MAINFISASDLTVTIFFSVSAPRGIVLTGFSPYASPLEFEDVGSMELKRGVGNTAVAYNTLENQSVTLTSIPTIDQAKTLVAIGIAQIGQTGGAPGVVNTVSMVISSVAMGIIHLTDGVMTSSPVYASVSSENKFDDLTFKFEFSKVSQG